MPIYEYKCANGHVFDVIQPITDEPLTECQECGASAERVLHPVAVHFKGSGFYSTDYGKRKAGAAGSDGAKESGESKASKGSESGGSSDSKSGGSSDSKSADSKATTAAAGD